MKKMIIWRESVNPFLKIKLKVRMLGTKYPLAVEMIKVGIQQIQVIPIAKRKKTIRCFD
jgi:hypothetical protein